jgi:hypothetical protein
MTSEPRVNLDRLVSQIVLDCSLLRWFAYNRRRDEVLAAIAFQRTRQGHRGAGARLPGPPLRRPTIKRQKSTSRAAKGVA